MRSAVRYIPNLLTLIRIPLGVVVFLTIRAGMYEAALLLFVLAFGTDLVDGSVARHFNMTSPLGERVLEPIADATLAILALLGIIVVERVSVWIVWSLVVLGIVYLLVVRTNRRSRVAATAWALEPFLDGACIIGITLWLLSHLNAGWYAIAGAFFLVALSTKAGRIRDHAARWQKIASA